MRQRKRQRWNEGSDSPQSRSNKGGWHRKADTGAGVIMTAAVLVTLLAFCSFAVNAALYTYEKGRLEKVARQVATYASTFLPDPAATLIQADAAYKALSKNMLTGNSLLCPGEEESDCVEMELSLLVGREAPANGQPPRRQLRKLVFTGDFDDLAGQIRFPIKSVNIKLTKQFKYKFLPIVDGFAGIEIEVEKKGELIPTDIVLIVEDSASLRSEIKGLEPQSDIKFDSSHPFKRWELAKLGRGYSTGERDIMRGNIMSNISNKAEEAIRQCFGEANVVMKKTAITVFDILSSAYYNRVAVLHSTSPGGEIGFGTIRFTPDSYLRANLRNPMQVVPGAIASEMRTPWDGEYVYMEPPVPNLTHGSTESHETRCAMLTKSSLVGTSFPHFAVPEHPFEKALGKKTINNPPEWFEDVFRKAIDDQFIDASEHPSEVIFKLKENPTLLPREILWIRNAGLPTHTGLPDRRSILIDHRALITRAIEMLRHAPAREDNLAVRRKVVLMLTDGLELIHKHASTFSPNNPLSNISFNQFQAVGEGNAESATETFTLYNPTKSLEALEAGKDTVCSGFDVAIGDNITNLIDDNTIPTIPESDSGASINSNGIVLNIAVMNSSAFGRPKNDPLVLQDLLPGHFNALKNGDSLITHINECNTPWSNFKGRALVVSTSVGPVRPTEDMEDFAGWLARGALMPNVVR